MVINNPIKPKNFEINNNMNETKIEIAMNL